MSASDYFFYIDTNGYCTNGNFVLATERKISYAKVCAWKPSVPNVAWGCDGHGGICWTSSSACTNSLEAGNVSMGNGLHSCVRPSGNKWCCRDFPKELCGLGPSEPNICENAELHDANPMKNFALDVAIIPASASSILSSLSLTISSPPAALMTTTVTQAATAAGDTSMTTTTRSSNHSSLSASSIAGVAVGVTIVLGAVVLGAFFALRHKSWRMNEHKAYSTRSEGPHLGPQAARSPVKELSETSAIHELSGLSATELPPQNGPRSEQRWELPS